MEDGFAIIPARVALDSTCCDLEKSTFCGREMRSKIPQFIYNVEEDMGVRQRDVKAKSKMKTCADTKVNVKKSNIQKSHIL